MHPDTKILKLAFIGDSLTQWYSWQKKFPQYYVRNLGISGERVEVLLERIPEIQTEIENVDIIFIMTGINNVADGHTDFVDDYRDIVRTFIAGYQGVKIVIQSILPTTLEWIANTTIAELNRRLEQTAIDLRVFYLDVYRLYVDNSGTTLKDLFLDDGAHLSTKGYEVWADEVERFLQTYT